jgi:hypothetical protein
MLRRNVGGRTRALRDVPPEDLDPERIELQNEAEML